MTNNLNYTFNKMTANEIASKIIEKEEAYLKTDIDSLTFKEKCELLLHNNSTHHPLFRSLDTSRLGASVSPELIRRAEEKDALALYYLAAINDKSLPRTDTRLGYLERAMNAGSLGARVQYASRFCNDGTDMTLKILEETLALYSTGDLIDDDGDGLYRCYDMLSRCARTPIDRERYQRILDELSVKLTLEGDWRAVTYLCIKESSTDEERAFWKSVAYITRSYFYDKGAIQFKDILSTSK